MKWITLIFWMLVFAGLYFFFQSFNIFSFQQQEEMQLFIPEWSYIREMLLIPGGFCTVAGQVLVQHYPNLWIAVMINASLLCAIGFLSFLILQKITRWGYHLFLALIPVFALLKVSMNPNYILDGTVGIAFMLLFLYAYLHLHKTRIQLIYSLISSVAFFFLFGQLTAIYGIILWVLSLLCQQKKWYYMIPACLTGLIFTYIGIRMAIYVPLTDGFYSERYQESQLQPDSYMYFVWIRFAVLLLIVLIAAYLMKIIPWDKRWRKISLSGGVVVGVLFFSSFCLPDSYDVQNRMMDQLAYFERQQKWDFLIRMHQGKKADRYIDLNYLNMALAREGKLADRLFSYDQKGSFGLLAPWNRTYSMSAMLSDIHFMLGDVSTAESYAMEGLTLARRKGSPRMLQRLVQVSLIRQEFKLAEKYIDFLSRMPYYHSWAEKHRIYLSHPEQMSRDKDLAVKQIPPLDKDNLLCLIETDSLWQMHVTESEVNRIATEYLGCSYLLAKEMDKFKSFLLRIGDRHEWQSLPTHFQEAALMLSDNDFSVSDSLQVQPEIRRRYKQFQTDMVRAGRNPNGVGMLYQQYGNTFWFYYHCKQLK